MDLAGVTKFCLKFGVLAVINLVDGLESPDLSPKLHGLLMAHLVALTCSSEKITCILLLRDDLFCNVK